VLSHDCDVVTGPAWLLWLELELELEPLPLERVSSELEPLPLCVELASPSSLCVLVDEPEELGVVVAVLEVPPLPSAATATHAATKVVNTPAVTRRRVVRRRCLTGEAGGCMPMIVAEEAWIFLGIRSAPGKAACALRFRLLAS
jgi:hypothetical protein